MPNSGLLTITEFHSIDDVVTGLKAIEAILAATADRRGVFVEAYLLITLELKNRIEQAGFEDTAWVSRYVVAFAELYRKALVAHEAGEAGLPKPWKAAFDAAKLPTTLILQDLVLGINAHINNDLPNALVAIGIDPERDSRKRDHDAVNDALRVATAPVEQRICELYAPGLGELKDQVFGLDKLLTTFSFEKARAAAWASGVSLVNAQGAEERALVRTHIDEGAGALAQLILAPNREHPLLIETLQKIEQGVHWQTAAFTRGCALAPLLLGKPLVVTSLAEVIARLQELIARYDAQRSRLSVYPTVYLDVSKRFQAALATPGFFSDPAWVEHLDTHFATLFFEALRCFEAGDLDAVPECWLTTLRSATDSTTTVLQDIMLALNVRLGHDLGIALYRAGVTEANTAARVQDFLKIHELFQAGIDPVQQTLSRKYSHFLGLLDTLGGRADEFAIDRTYLAARDGALRTARELAALPSDGARCEFLANIDIETTNRAKAILLSHVPGGHWLGRVLRRVEDAFPGTWSDLIAGD
jgi:uncharacterized small protein (DUF1192 family)